MTASQLSTIYTHYPVAQTITGNIRFVGSAV